MSSINVDSMVDEECHWEIQETQETQGTQETLQTAVTIENKHDRGPNYLINEDVQLARSWLDISQDPIIGADQKGCIFWDRVKEHWHEHMEGGHDIVRTCRSL